MRDPLTMIRQLQQTYVSAYGFTIAITDTRKQLLTAPVFASDLDQWIYHHLILAQGYFNRFPQREWQLKEALIWDLEDTGLIFMVVPFLYSDGRTYLIWSGPFQESDSVTIEGILRINGVNAEQGMGLLRTGKGPVQFDRKMIKEKTMELAEALSVCVDCVFRKEGDEAVPGQLMALLSCFSEFTGDIRDLLKTLLTRNPQISFVGYAEKQSDNEFAVAHYLGKGSPSLEGASFSIGEGYLGQVAITEQSSHWRCLTSDPRMRFFSLKGVAPTELFCHPVKINSEVEGLLFYGNESPLDAPRIADLEGRITAGFLGYRISERRLLSELDTQRSRVMTLMEISRVITSVRDTKRIMFLLIDMALNLIHHARSALLLVRKPGNSQAFDMVTRGLPKDKADQYGKFLAAKYWHNGTGSSEDPAPMKPPEGSSMGLESAIKIQEEVAGVLSVLVEPQAADPSEEIQYLLDTLALMGSTALEQTIAQTANATSPVYVLHEAMGQWNADQYELCLKMKDYVSEFGQLLRCSQETILNGSNAGLLYFYNPDVLRKSAVSEGIIETVTSCRRMKTDEVGEESYSDSAQLLFVVSEYVVHHKIVSHPLISSKWLEEFRLFVNYREKKVSEIRIKPDQQLGDQVSRLPGLSPREREVLIEITRGKNNKEIAEALYISENTVKNHITSIFNKVGVSDRIQLMTKVIYPDLR